MTEVSPRWLDSVVTAHHRLAEAGNLLGELRVQLRHADCEYEQYTDEASEILWRDGTSWRFKAMERRIKQLAVHLDTAEQHGYNVGPVLLGATEVIDTLKETVLNTDALLADARDLAAQHNEELRNDPYWRGAYGDPTIDRLEEHPAYERS